MTMVPLDRTAEIPSHVAYQRLDDELALVNLDSNVYYGLNPVGTRLWELLVEDGRLRAAYDRMAAEYDVPLQQLERDVLQVVEELQSKGLLTLR